MSATADQSSGRRARTSTVGGAAASIEQLAVVVEGELRRMRSEPDDVGLILALVGDPRANQLLAEDTASGQELVVCLQRVQRLVERARHLRHAAVFLEEVPVGRLACVETLLDPV